MIIIGERLNSSRKPVYNAMLERDTDYILEQAFKQVHAGADAIDINSAALLDKEVEVLTWMLPLLQEKIPVPISIDTSNPEAMEVGLEYHQGQAFLNSLSGEQERIISFLPLIKKYKPKVIVLCLDNDGLPTHAEQEYSVAARMVELLDRENVPLSNIFIDPLVRPVGVDQTAPRLFLESLKKIKKNIPEIKTIAGISNVSFGLPNRKLINRTFLVLAVQEGLDAAIIDPLDQEKMASLSAAKALLGKDPNLKGFLGAVRSGRI
ncbi:MAG: dihydropteroate synthase [Candidatus Aminicenantes bacterium]|nr:dihydropteroate synthase [Candidatus Aminicenantes bacterium]